MKKCFDLFGLNEKSYIFAIMNWSTSHCLGHISNLVNAELNRNSNK